MPKKFNKIRAQLGNIRLGLHRRIGKIDETIGAVEKIQEVLAEEKVTPLAASWTTIGLVKVRETQLKLTEYPNLIRREVRVVNSQTNWV